MSESNRRKAAELGMPFGTASNRLRKMILFRFAQWLGEDICFRCGGRIESVDDLSIEHKRPWFGGNASLFWDPDNIAFSHLTCNRPEPERHAGIQRRKVGPPGTAWCYRCRAFLPVKEFGTRRGRWNGLNGYCQSCHRQNVKDYEDRNRMKVRERKRLYMRDYMRRYRSGVA